MTATSARLTAYLFIVMVIGLGLLSLKPLTEYEASGELDALTGEWARKLESHYDERFPVRDLGTNLWAAINFVLFREGRPGVIVGQHGWLFSSEEFYPEAAEPGLVDTNLERVKVISQHLRRQGIPLVVLVVPAKARIYEEKLAGEQPAREMASLYNRLLATLDIAGVPAPALADELDEAAAEGTQVFLRTDTHWSPVGADLFARQAAIHIRDVFDDQPWGEQTFFTTQEEPIRHRGDLLNYIPVDPLFSGLGPAPDMFSPRTTAAGNSTSDASESLFGEADTGTVLVGTSYSANPLWDFPGALRKYLGRDLINVAEEGKGPIVPMVEYLQSSDFRDHPPELVIWEFPERYLARPVESEQVTAWFRQAGALYAQRPGIESATNP